MKKLYFVITLIGICFATAQTGYSHAIWIESNTKATKNEAHTVKIYYGDYPEQIIEPTDKWYSDLKNLEVWVTSPSGQKTKLVLTDAKDHLISSFIPAEDGIYYITTVHVTKDLGGTTKYEFSSVSTILAGKGTLEARAPVQPLAVSVDPIAYKTNANIQLLVATGGQPLVDSEVKIMSPDGWVKTLKTNDKGQVTFKPKIKGRYIVEGSAYKKEEGEWHSKKYTHTWKGSTAYILVN